MKNIKIINTTGKYMNHYVFDLETLGTESTAVILSIAITPFCFETDRKTTFNEFRNRTFFYKFEIEEQLRKGRTICKTTMDWWHKQSECAKKRSFHLSSLDQPAIIILNQIRSFINPQNSIFWQRGSLDQVCLESLCRSYEQQPIIGYWNWRDIRTTINLCGESNYYKPEHMDGFVAHDPASDCAKDALTLVTI